MAQVVGRSGCTTALLEGLRRMGMREPASFADIEHFLRTSDAQISEVRSREEQVLRTRISELQAGAQATEQAVERASSARRSELTGELARLPLDLAGIEVQGARTSVAALRKWLLRLRMRLRLRTLTLHFEREVLRPHRRALRKARRDRERAARIERNVERSLDAAAAILVRAKEYLANAGQRDYLGAVGEEQVLAELRSLSDDFVVFNDVTFRLPQPQRWPERGETIQTAQVDHVVVGNDCVFLLETKNWSLCTLRDAAFTPQHQMKRANHVAHCLAKKTFGRRKVHLRNLVVMTHDRGDVTARRPTP